MEAGVRVGQEDQAEGVGDRVELRFVAVFLYAGEAGGEAGEGFAGQGAGGFEGVAVDAEEDAFVLFGEVFDAAGCGVDVGHGWDGRSRPVMIIPDGQSAARRACLRKSFGFVPGWLTYLA